MLYFIIDKFSLLRTESLNLIKVTFILWAGRGSKSFRTIDNHGRRSYSGKVMGRWYSRQRDTNTSEQRHRYILLGTRQRTRELHSQPSGKITSNFMNMCQFLFFIKLKVFLRKNTIYFSVCRTTPREENMPHAFHTTLF